MYVRTIIFAPLHVCVPHNRPYSSRTTSTPRSTSARASRRSGPRSRRRGTWSSSVRPLSAQSTLAHALTHAAQAGAPRTNGNTTRSRSTRRLACTTRAHCAPRTRPCVRTRTQSPRAARANCSHTSTTRRSRTAATSTRRTSGSSRPAACPRSPSSRPSRSSAGSTTATSRRAGCRGGGRSCTRVCWAHVYVLFCPGMFLLGSCIIVHLGWLEDP
jgi:hypothetical protein